VRRHYKPDLIEICMVDHEFRNDEMSCMNRIKRTEKKTCHLNEKYKQESN